MALPDWILGILFRPGDTYERALTEMRFSYWWILLSVFTIEGAMLLYHPAVQRMVPTPPADLVLTNLGLFLLLVFFAQSACLFAVGRSVGWVLRWGEAMKFSALTWAIFLVEDMVTFYSFLREQEVLIFWVAIPFLVWRLVVLGVGVHRVAGFTWPMAALISLLATLPWQAVLLYQAWPYK